MMVEPTRRKVDTSRIIVANTLTCGRNSTLKESQMCTGIVFVEPFTNDVMM